MTITPVEHEPERFLVDPETGELPWLVDINPCRGLPPCACAVWYNRTPDRWNCKHIRAVRERTPQKKQ